MRLKLFPSLLTLCLGVGAVVWRDGLQPVAQALPAPTSRVASAEGDVPYVPTPDEVVVEMLKMADVTKDDVVYDLGSGDGRVVVTAAQQFGSRGVGIEIDSKLIDKSNDNARLAGVSDRVKFVKQDLFEADFKDASVVTLFLLTQVNLQLRPKLLSELKPGTRIVSHQFKMAGWKPDRDLVMRVGSRYHVIYYWIVPAQVEGTWQWNIGEDGYSLRLRQDFQEIRGTLKSGDRTLRVTDEKLTGDRLSFQVTQPIQGKMTTMQFNGRVSNDTITGSMEIIGGKEGDRQDWVAKRR